MKNIADKIKLPTKTTLNAKINKIKEEILSITNLVTIAALNAKKIKLKAKYLTLIT